MFMSASMGVNDGEHNQQLVLLTLNFLVRKERRRGRQVVWTSNKRHSSKWIGLIIFNSSTLALSVQEIRPVESK